MSIGYACLTVKVEHTDQKTCRLKNVDEARLSDIIEHNLNSLENIIDYNINNQIRIFRISSDIIPFGSSVVNKVLWDEKYSTQLVRIGEKIKTSNMRVSMHPGQYTVLNSPNEEIVNRAMEDLNYHTKVLDSLKLGEDNKIVLHIGGIYNEKDKAIDRFVANYKKLDDAVKRRLVIENDDKSYHIGDVLKIGVQLNIPVIFDNLHHSINPCEIEMTELDWINECKKTWCEKDGNQKIHYSQQNPKNRPGSHSESIRINEFMEFYERIGRKDLDIMLEVKDKNLSAIKCINATTQQKEIKLLELEWSRYKYTILENSPSDYVKIRKLLQNKKNYPVISFYNLIEDALQQEVTVGNAVNAALHVWGYFKNSASDKEKENFLKSIDAFRNGTISIQKVKKSLWKMAIKYKEPYLLATYYLK